jgi:hypothetical protein
MLNCRGNGESNSAWSGWFRIHKHIFIVEGTKGNHHKVQFPISKNNAFAITGLQNHRVRTNRRARLPQQSFNVHNGNWNLSFEIYLKMTLIEIVLALFILTKYTDFKFIVTSLYLSLVIYDNRSYKLPWEYKTTWLYIWTCIRSIVVACIRSDNICTRYLV